MALGNLSVKVGADVSDFTSNMSLASQVAKDKMGASSASVNGFRDNLLRASQQMAEASKAMSDSMAAAALAIQADSEQAAKSVAGISDAANDSDFRTLGEKIRDAIQSGVDSGVEGAKEKFGEATAWMEAKAKAVSIAVGLIFAAVGLGALYAAYKVIKATADLAVGLFTGETYKSENIDALIAANDQIKKFQESLGITAQAASGLNAALAVLGVNANDYVAVFTNAQNAVRKNTDELDRLGIKYKDQNGNLLETSQFIQNVKTALDEYTEGWDRNAAAAAIGIGSYQAVSEAAKVTKDAIAEARDRLNEYNLGIGAESQAAVTAYQDATRKFNRELDLMKDGFKRAIADNIMPLLTDLANWFREGWPSVVNGFRYSMATITTLFYGLKTTIYIVAESIVGSISAIGNVLASLGKAAYAALHGDLDIAKQTLIEGWTDAKTRLGQIGDNIATQAQHNAQAVRLAWAMDDRDSLPSQFKKKKKFTPAPDEPDSGNTRRDPFDTAMFDAQRQLVGTQFVIDHFDKLGGKVRESKAAMAEFDVTLGRFADKQRTLEGYDPLTPEQKAKYIETNRLLQQALETERQKQVLRQFDKSAAELDYRESLALENRRVELGLMGQSAVEISKVTEARRIDGEVAQLLHTTEIELGKEGLKITAAQRAEILAKADASKQAAAELIQQGYDQSRDPWFNANEAMRQYGEDAENVGAQIGNALTHAFRNAEDAFVQFTLTGKLSFSDLARSVIADLARMQAQSMISGFFNLLVSSFSSGSSYNYANDASGSQFSQTGDMVRGRRASGGPVSGGSTYLVGEVGPELFTPSQSGYIVPNDRLNSGGPNVSIVQNISIDSRSDAASIMQAMRATKDATIAEIRRQIAQGSSAYARA